MKILVVDDEELIRNVIREYLIMEEYTVDEANDGLEAITKAKENDYNLIIMDIMMPKLITFFIFQSSYFTSTESPINSLIIELFTMLSSSSTSST